jgi:uncharacterized protein
MPEDFEDPENSEEDLDLPPAFFPLETPGRREPAEPSRLVECQIEGVFVAENAGQISRFVLLTDGERKLPILIGPYEAQAISFPLEGSRADRPMTHDLLKNIIDRLNSGVDRIVIDDLWNGIFYAKIYLRVGKGEEVEIDARPSDAIALAARYDASVFVSEAILEAEIEEG